MKKTLKKLARMRNRYILAYDVVVFTITPLIALMLRLESVSRLGPYIPDLCVFTACMIFLKVGIFLRGGLYKEYWPYASSDALVLLTKVSIAAQLLQIGSCYLVLLPTGILHQGFPRSIPIVDGFLSIMGAGAGRLALRVFYTIHPSELPPTPTKNVLIAGAGAAGAMTAGELQRNRHLGLVPIGFVDDDHLKISRRLHGLEVLGSLAGIPVLVKERKISEVVIAMPTAPGLVVRRVMQLCKEAGVKTKTIPGIFEIIRGTAKVDQIRNIRLEDLLRRGTVKIESANVARLVHGEVVMVTGAGGSIGSELCRQITFFDPSQLVLLGHGENSIFDIANELERAPGKEMSIHRVIADIRDRERMRQVFEEHRPTLVFHAAAHKHVPLMEENIAEAVTNNALGTKILVDLAAEFDVKRLVMISSDKAVNPTSYMGVTKRIAELIVQEISWRKHIPFVTVRFGNVLGSRGSVVPYFEQQIEMGGPVTVTHPEIKRYFMTIPEAAQLVLQAGSMAKPCELFVLDMGEQIKMADLARDLIRLSGREEGRDIEIKFTGLRPGEKMYEELFYDGEVKETTEHQKIFVCKNGLSESLKGSGSIDDESLRVQIETLVEAANQRSLDIMNRVLKKLVPQFTPTTNGSHASLQVPTVENGVGIAPGTPPLYSPPQRGGEVV
jgi:FlaA1/EpsC-like NDP-sugar epimerase